MAVFTAATSEDDENVKAGFVTQTLVALFHAVSLAFIFASVVTLEPQ